MHDILLEAGTNEVEFLEFYLGKQSFGLNVAKVKQLIRHHPEKLTYLPESYHSVVGSLDHVDRNIPIVDLGLHLKHRMLPSHEHQIVVITDFNNAMTGFIVDGVNKIHRISWDKLQPVSSALEHLNPRITGVVIVDKREVMILDFEYILDDIRPDLALTEKHNVLVEEKAVQTPLESVMEKRRKCNVYFAEDSNLFRHTLLSSLAKVGYEQVTSFVNGHDLLIAARKTAAELAKKDMPLSSHVSLVLTDIEMPQMDGLTLCRNLKQLDKLLPVVVLSSLITEEMAHKCKAVGADANLSKKNLSQLLEKLDHFTLGK